LQLFVTNKTHIKVIKQNKLCCIEGSTCNTVGTFRCL